ncbi:transmembrane protein, putative [Medicago truncatula]|nr:transmembrane protein, putative [Medicago truncatula]
MPPFAEKYFPVSPISPIKIKLQYGEGTRPYIPTSIEISRQPYWFFLTFLATNIFVFFLQDKRKSLMMWNLESSWKEEQVLAWEDLASLPFGARTLFPRSLS